MNECQLNRIFDISSPTESTDSGIQINMEQTTVVCTYYN
jgi:hypothetical protein